MASTKRTISIFVSYSHQDERFRKALTTQLDALKGHGPTTVWSDHRISGGQEFDRVIARQLHGADLILLLVSPHFLASKYCYSIELKTAMKRHHRGSTRVLPIIVRPCVWDKTPFAKLAAVPRDGKPVTMWRPQDSAYLDIAKAIRTILEEFTKSKPRPKTAPRTSGSRRAPARRPDTAPDSVTVHSVDWRADIAAGGREAVVHKTTVLTANEPNITTLVDRDFGSTGKLQFTESTMGTIMGPVDEGGSWSVTTVLREPLPIGQPVSNTLTIRATDTFTSSKETFGHLVAGCCGRLRIRINLPRTRKARQASAIQIYGGKTRTLPDSVLSRDGLRLNLEVVDPPVGARYLLEWRW